MLLHRMVDRALTPLLSPLGMEHATEGYVTISREDLDGLTGDGHGAGDPQAVLAGFGPRATASGVMIAEPTLSSAVLSRIWRSDRNQGAPLTQVEGEILRQFLARIVGAWAESWAEEGVKLLPEFTMAGSLSMLTPQLVDGRWYVARVVVRDRDDDEPIGVLLFCYPEALMPQLSNEARSTMWRSRIEHGMDESTRQRLASRLSGPLRDVVITAPVTLRQHVTLGMLNALERGDVLAFDEDAEGAIELDVLGRTVSARLAAHGDNVALALTRPDDPSGASEQPPDARPMNDAAMPDFGQSYDHDPEFATDFDLTA